jgi:hypothetical protein
MCVKKGKDEAINKENGNTDDDCIVELPSSPFVLKRIEGFHGRRKLA